LFEQTFKNIDDVLWKEAGCTTELDYTEQTSWLLFLKYLDDLEQERALEAGLVDKSYEFLIDEPHRWSSWAAPKQADGSFDHDNAITGDDLIKFVDDDLFPYLESFKQQASNPDTIEYNIGEIFGGGMATICWSTFIEFSAYRRAGRWQYQVVPWTEKRTQPRRCQKTQGVVER